LCFIADGNYRNFIRRNRPAALVPGPILDAQGNRLGTHTGLGDYTVGQRKGLSIAAPQAYYVTALDAARNALIVGHAAELGKRELVAQNVNWIPPRLRDELPLRVTVKNSLSFGRASRRRFRALRDRGRDGGCWRDL
jgi:tRNA U34 2-thiouridine synthase MnmA/TrmU